MNDSHSSRPESEGDTATFHLNGFAHGTPLPEARAESGEGETQFIRRAAVDAVGHSSKPVVVPAAAGPLSPDELLGAVAYCYVRGVFSSADIERRMLRDPEFREALEGAVPDPAAIRRFRRLNREAIQTVLEKFYCRLRQQQKMVTPVGLEPGPRADENTALYTRRAASERLDQATFVDGMSDF